MSPIHTGWRRGPAAVMRSCHDPACGHDGITRLSAEHSQLRPGDAVHSDPETAPARLMHTTFEEELPPAPGPDPVNPSLRPQQAVSTATGTRGTSSARDEVTPPHRVTLGRRGDPVPRKYRDGQRTVGETGSTPAAAAVCKHANGALPGPSRRRPGAGQGTGEGRPDPEAGRAQRSGLAGRMS